MTASFDFPNLSLMSYSKTNNFAPANNLKNILNRQVYCEKGVPRVLECCHIAILSCDRLVLSGAG